MASDADGWPAVREAKVQKMTRLGGENSQDDVPPSRRLSQSQPLTLDITSRDVLDMLFIHLFGLAARAITVASFLFTSEAGSCVT